MSMLNHGFYAPLGRFWPQSFGGRLFEGWEHLLFIPDSPSLGESVVADEPSLDGGRESVPAGRDGG